MTRPQQSFHNRHDELRTVSSQVDGVRSWAWAENEVRTWTQWALTVSFRPHFHPFVQELMERLVRDAVPGVQEADTEPRRRDDGTVVTVPGGQTPVPALYADLFTGEDYQPTKVVAVPYPVADLDFSTDGAYAVYNWELFFHIPVAIAVHLGNNGRFEEAQRWFHYVFDPTDDSDGPTPERYWKTKPFRTTDVQAIEDVLTNLSTRADQRLLERTVHSLREWQEAPFRPHVVARHRPSAYMIWTVTEYIRLLTAWGDALYRQDTAESVAEATQLYVLAANILGPRPQQVPVKGTVLPQTYRSLRGRLDDMSNALVRLETSIPFDRFPEPGPVGADTGPRRLTGMGQALYFCVPRNEQLLRCWDEVGRRLFNIRNSLNLQGVFRLLPTVDAPIDPAALARAAASGVDVAAVVAGANQPAPFVRFGALVARAGELCQEVKSLGTSLLSAIANQDGEALSVLRARHESAVLRLAETVKFGQHQEAVKNREALEGSLKLAQDRYTYYERLLGRDPSQITFEALSLLDESQLAKKRFSATEPAIPPRAVEVDIDESAASPGGGPAGGKKISSHEVRELSELGTAQSLQDVAAGLEGVGAVLNLLPIFSGDVKPFGLGAGADFGGFNISRLLSGLASVPRGMASRHSFEASQAARIASYARREQEWQFQSNSAAGDVSQFNKQVRAAQLREFIAKQDLDNHRKQIQQAEEMEAFLTGEKASGKTTTTAYYALLRREVRGVYNACYELALETARKAEGALRQELGDPALTFIRPSYLAGPEGLLAGEKLHMDVRRMELAHLDLNRREYELTQRVSLLQIEPWALVQLRATGRCAFSIPEELFDFGPRGHYFRRLRSVSVSVPCTVGDLTGVTCTVRLVRSRVRTSPVIGDAGYPADPDGDDRFVELLGSTDAIVTSRGINDTGRFDGPPDERLEPFELKGAVGDWQLELPTDPAPVDRSTITDVVLLLRYTAREGGEALRRAAGAHLRELIARAEAAGTTRLLSMRHEFPTAWARLTAGQAGDGQDGNSRAELSVDLRREHYPYFAEPASLVSLDFVAQPRDPATDAFTVADRALDGDTPDETSSVRLTRRSELGGLLRGSIPRAASGDDPGWVDLPEPVGRHAFYFENNDLQELYLVVRWQG
jgi:hypothetical protein